MLDFGLTRQYKVETRASKQLTKPGIDLFQEGFYFSTLKTGMAELITNCDDMLSKNPKSLIIAGIYRKWCYDKQFKDA